jgi:signal transduction histidine kinase
MLNAVPAGGLSNSGRAIPDDSEFALKVAGIDHDEASAGLDSRAIGNMEVAGQLAAGIAHHFNNLLTPIHANSELLLELHGGSHAESKDLLEQTLVASRRAAHLIRQLAGFSQIQRVDFQAVDLNEVVEPNLREILLFANGNIKCECHYGANLPRVLADSAMLGQIIGPLVVNALDAMPNGGRITLTTEKSVTAPLKIGNPPGTHPGEFVCLTISDTGCGIGSADLPRIFEPFFTTKDAAGRSGLGLALVHGIVKQHQGWTEVSSEAGRGAVFKIFLPAVSRPVTIAGKETPRLPKPAADGAIVRKSSATRTVYHAREMRGEAPVFWGIND